jgi:hypothetical protein
MLRRVMDDLPPLSQVKAEERKVVTRYNTTQCTTLSISLSSSLHLSLSFSPSVPAEWRRQMENGGLAHPSRRDDGPPFERPSIAQVRRSAFLCPVMRCGLCSCVALTLSLSLSLFF